MPPYDPAQPGGHLALPTRLRSDPGELLAFAVEHLHHEVALVQVESRAMNRRAVVSGAVLAIAVAPWAARAQPARAVYRLGMLSSASASATDRTTAPYLIPAALREMGYVEGQNLFIERRFADGKLDRLPALARELGQLRLDVILGLGPSSLDALRESTDTVPLVMFVAVDPVGRGWVTSLARPGGRITGLVLALDTRLAAKRLELLREAVPQIKRIAVLTTDEPHAREQAEVTRQSAPTAAVTVVVVEVREGAYSQAFEQMRTASARALIVVASPILNRDRKQIIELAARHRLPAIYQWSDHVDEGGLMSYGSSIAALARRAAVYVDRIFKGTSPADLPIEQPSTYELVINRKTARGLGLALPATFLMRADRTLD
jgi:putative ABC transport system substrate-binding protein